MPRWRFRSGSTREEEAEREAVTSLIDAWWSEFATKAEDLDRLFRNQSDWDMPAWMRQTLNAVSSDLCWEFGPGLEGGHRLVITPESRKVLRPLVGELLARAPRLAGWEFYAYRPAESYEMTLQTVEARTGGDVSGSVFVARRGNGNRFDLTFGARSSGDADTNFGRYFVATETLLGEEVLDKWVGAIEVVPASDVPDARPVAELRVETERVIGQIRESLPGDACWRFAKTAPWTVFRLEPSDEASDYAGQSDMFVGKSLNEQLWKTTHSGLPFCSARFSRVGETFCYVKLDGRQGLDEEMFADKSEMEDALDAALVPGGLGCHIGGGTGKWYSYVDLALTDVDRGCEVVRRVLGDGHVPRRSWILFFDDEWAREWIGIYDDSPPPRLPAGP